MGGGCHTIVNIRMKGALHVVQDRYFYFQCWFCLYSLGGGRNPTKTSLQKEHFICGRNMEFPKVRTAGSSDCISIKQLAFFPVPHLLLSSIASLQAEGSCGLSGSGPALGLRTSPGAQCLPIWSCAHLQGEPLYLSRSNTSTLGQLCCSSPAGCWVAPGPAGD